MSPERLLKHFEQISEAPDAVPRLRRFILDLAVRGKLVEQNPNDEPAEELLKRITTEKSRFEKKEKLRHQRQLPPIVESEQPFDLSFNWKWVPIREITTDRGQIVPTKKFSYIDVSSINKDRGTIADRQVLTPDAAPSRARKIVRKGDVIYSCVRPYLLNIAIVEDEIEPEPIVSTAFAVLNGLGLVSPRYLWIVLRSPFFVSCVEVKMRGQAYPAINDRDFELLPFPLPPLAEQHRIVAKVDELMALCDKLEAAQAKREKRRDRLVAATLHGLNNGDASPARGTRPTFHNSARFYLNHLPRLTTRPEHIHQLRQTILNLAIRGKLVKQNPLDEPSSKLLKRIAEEKGRLIEASKLKKQETPEALLDSDPPFEVPTGWEWARAGTLFLNVTDGFHNTPKPTSYGYKYITAQHLRPGKIDFDGCLYVDEKNHKELFSKTRVKKGDVLIVNIGAGCGNPAIVEVDFEFSFNSDFRAALSVTVI